MQSRVASIAPRVALVAKPNHVASVPQLAANWPVARDKVTTTTAGRTRRACRSEGGDRPRQGAPSEGRGGLAGRPRKTRAAARRGQALPPRNIYKKVLIFKDL